MGKESYYFCKEPFYYSDFRGLHKFWQHLNRAHVKNQENDKHDFSQCTNSESNEYTITNNPINNINFSKFHHLDSYSIHENYELSE